MLPADEKGLQVRYVADGDRLQRFGKAMAKVRQDSGLSQAALSVQVKSNQSTISSWERGESEPPPEFVFAIERACNEPQGSLSRLLGYMPIIEDVPDAVEQAISSCPKLDANQRRLLRDIFIMMSTAED